MTRYTGTRTLNTFRAALVDALGDHLAARTHVTYPDNTHRLVTARLRDPGGPVATVTATPAPGGTVTVTIDHPRFAGAWPPVPARVAGWAAADHLRAAWEARP